MPPGHSARLLPADVQPQWLNVVRRLQSVSVGHRGLAIVKIAVLVDERGTPIQWAEPTRKLLEPKDDMTVILQLLTEG